MRRTARASSAAGTRRTSGMPPPRESGPSSARAAGIGKGAAGGQRRDARRPELEARPRRDRLRDRGLRREAPRRYVGDLHRHEGAARFFARDPTLGGQLAVRREDGVAMNTERRGERARPRERVAGAQPAAADVIGDGPRDAQERGPRGAGRARVEIDGHRPGAHRSGLADWPVRGRSGVPAFRSGHDARARRCRG